MHLEWKGSINLETSLKCLCGLQTLRSKLRTPPPLEMTIAALCPAHLPQEKKRMVTSLGMRPRARAVQFCLCE